MTRTIRWLVAAAAGGCLLVVANHPAALAGPPAPKSPIIITADALDFDSQGSIVIATGHVRISDGKMTATGGRATLRQSERRAVLADGARVIGSQGILQATEIAMTYTTQTITRIAARGEAQLETRSGRLMAPSITITLTDQTLLADGGVTILAPPDGRATGRRLTYGWTRGAAVLEGDARAQNREGFVSGDRIQAEDRSGRATVTGSVLARFRDIEVRSHTAEVFGAEKKAVFAGDVSVKQPGRELLTEKATVWYDTRRVVAEGQTRVRLEGQP